MNKNDIGDIGKEILLVLEKKELTEGMLPMEVLKKFPTEDEKEVKSIAVLLMRKGFIRIDYQEGKYFLRFKGGTFLKELSKDLKYEENT